MKMTTYSIKDLEQLTGIKAHTIRMWEKRYNLIAPERTDSNIRFYSEEELRRLLNISLLNKNGQKISKLASLSNLELCEMVNSLNSELSDKSHQIDLLTRAMINLDENGFNRTLNKAIVKNGFEETLQNLVYPFLEKVGVLWQTGIINPSREHFVSAILKQKIYTAYDRILASPGETAQSIVFALNDREYHELSLLIGNYIAKRLKYNTVYLGQAVPYSSLKEIIEYTGSNILVTNFITSQEEKYIINYLKRISSDFPTLMILAGGHQIQIANYSLPENVIKINDATMFKNVLKNMENQDQKL